MLNATRNQSTLANLCASSWEPPEGEGSSRIPAAAHSEGSPRQESEIFRNITTGATVVVVIVVGCWLPFVRSELVASYARLLHFAPSPSSSSVQIDLFNFLIGLLQNTTNRHGRPFTYSLRCWWTTMTTECANTRDRTKDVYDKFICITPLMVGYRRRCQDTVVHLLLPLGMNDANREHLFARLLQRQIKFNADGFVVVVGILGLVGSCAVAKPRGSFMTTRD